MASLLFINKFAMKLTYKSKVNVWKTFFAKAFPSYSIIYAWNNNYDNKSEKLLQNMLLYI